MSDLDGYTKLTPAMKQLVRDLGRADFEVSGHWQEMWKRGFYPPSHLSAYAVDGHGWLIDLTATGGFGGAIRAEDVDRSVSGLRSIKKFRQLSGLPS